MVNSPYRLLVVCLAECTTVNVLLFMSSASSSGFVRNVRHNGLTDPIVAAYDPAMDMTSDDVAAVIDAAGGAKALAIRMGWEPKKGYARVRRWKCEGHIPPMVVKAYAPMFKRLLAKAAKGQA